MKTILTLTFVVFLSACASSHQNINVTNQYFPSLSGTSLENKPVDISDLFVHENTILLIGYKQDSQFDIDRWLIGLDMTNTPADVYELPTIAGMLPRMFSTQIDNGMRRGIPKELWKGVITIYQDGDLLQKFTGNKNPNNARVMVINQKGIISYFYDRGFSVAALNELRKTINIKRN